MELMNILTSTQTLEMCPGKRPEMDAAAISSAKTSGPLSLEAESGVLLTMRGFL